jgi:glycosyltransferase involved in cell wall biosynthesis
MPTGGRRELALQAVRYFLAQDYPKRELVIVDSGSDGLYEELVRADGRIRYVHIDVDESIGAKRNRAAALAGGDILAQWDDDDWHGPRRLSLQVASIQSAEADITALRDCTMFQLAEWKFWRCTPELHSRLFVHDVHSGTLVYRRSVWEQLAQYPDASLAEDAAFLDRALRRGARLRAIPANDDFLYVRHDSNAWALQCGSEAEAGGWREVDQPPLGALDRRFYAARSRAAPHAASIARCESAPLVSCIMPTRDRRRFINQAIAYFLRQDYPNKELVVVDDGRDPIDDLIPASSGITYKRLSTPMILGAKRNLACSMSSGTFIAHWDDDDWHAPHRLRTQVMRLLDTDMELCGTSELLFLDLSSSAAWRFAYPRQHRPWAAGTSLVYRRNLWSRSPFPEIAIGEDTRFTWSAAVKSIADVADTHCVIAVRHEANSSSHSTHSGYWTSIPIAEVEQILGEDLDFYRLLRPAAMRSNSPESKVAMP